jgi:hypothetical protein
MPRARKLKSQNEVAMSVKSIATKMDGFIEAAENVKILRETISKLHVVHEDAEEKNRVAMKKLNATIVDNRKKTQHT